MDRLTGAAAEGVPNYTMLESGLYLGGICLRPPPNTYAVLSVTATRDSFSAEVYEWQPVQSGPAPTVGWLRRQVAFIDKYRRENLTVFVHCDAGIDRSAMVVVAYFMWRDGLSRDAALEFVQRKRPSVHPNPVFMALLTEWEEALGQEKKDSQESKSSPLKTENR